MATTIREAAAVGELAGNRQLITLITPGWGSSGYYSPAVLEQAAKDRVFPAKTQMHIDHDGEMARYEQPAGSLTRLAAGLLEDARWEPDWVDPDNPGTLPGRLAAEADVFSQWRVLLTEAQDYIGASIAAGATVKKGEAEGRKGNIVEALHPHVLNRVDYVTAAGRGGKISAVLESRINRQIAEATANETRKLILDALRAWHADEDTWVWLRDYDEARAWFEVENADGFHIYEQAYTITNDVVSLADDPVEVRATTQYVPVTATPSTTTTVEAAAAATKESSPAPAEVKEKAKSKETSLMAEINIEESRLATLEESHGRVPALEAKLDATVSENATLKESLAKAKAANRAREFATSIVKAANADLSESVVARIVAQSTAPDSLPLTEALQLDTDALTATVNTARESEETYLALLAKENGLGQVRGIGATESATSKTFTDDDIVNAL